VREKLERDIISYAIYCSIPYLSHILVRIFLPFGLPNLIFGGISKDTKKPTDPQCFKYESVG